MKEVKFFACNKPAGHAVFHFLTSVASGCCCQVFLCVLNASSKLVRDCRKDGSLCWEGAAKSDSKILRRAKTAAVARYELARVIFFPGQAFPLSLP